MECVDSRRSGGRRALTRTEYLIRESENQLSVTVRGIHRLEEPIESLLYTHKATGSLPYCLLDNGCKLFLEKKKKFFLRHYCICSAQ